MGETQGRTRLLFLGPDPPPPVLGGCETIWIPVLKAYSVEGSSARVLEELSREKYDAIVFTSPRAPRMLALDAEKQGVTSTIREKLGETDVWVIGPGTRESLRKWLGVKAYESRIHTGAGLAGELLARGYKRVLGLRSPTALPDLAHILTSSGVYYTEINVYEVKVDPSGLERLESLINHVEERQSLLPVLTSPSIADTFLDLVDRLGLKEAIPLVSLGPTTAETLRRRGREPLCMPSTYSLAGLGGCLERFCSVTLSEHV